MAINALAEKYDMPILYSCHPRSKKRLESSGFQLDPRVRVNEPLGFNDYNKLQMNALAIVSDSGTLPEESSFYLSIGHPIAAVCIRTSTERPEALEAGDFILAGIRTDELLNATSIAIEMKQKGVLGKPCPDYVDETVSMKVDRIIQGYEGAPAILVLDHLTYRQKEYLLRDHIPFVVEGKQIYLPFMAVYLQERSDSERKEADIMLPSAQLLLLHYIYHGCGEMMTSEASQKLNFTSTSISRASRQLEEMGLVRTEKRGVQKVIYSEKTPEELFYAAKDSMGNPVKRTIFVPKADVGEDLLMSGYTALSEYTMMNPPAVKCVAADSISAWEKRSSIRLQNSEDQYEVQLWRYDPKKLVTDHCVDRLSLALALGDDRDERVEEAVEEMLQQVWRDIDGQRN